MRIINVIFLIILLANFFDFAIAQTTIEEGYAPDRVIMWNKVGQRETLKKCEEHLIMYMDAEPEITYMRYVQSKNPDEYIVELATHASQAKPKPIDVTQSIIIPMDGSSPIALKKTSSSATRQIVFTKMDQREFVMNGETVNISYGTLNTDKVYISYESTEDGYFLQLSSLLEQKVVTFARRCQSFIVATPATTTIRVEDVVRYEQLIWTPRADNSWEVRIGTVAQGCKSAALDAIDKLRTKEYETSVPIETKNSKR